MAKKNSSNSNNNSATNLSALSFIAVMLVGLSLLISFILGRVDESFENAANILQSIGLALAILVPVILSYKWARRQKAWVFLLWIISILIVLAFYVLNLFL